MSSVTSGPRLAPANPIDREVPDHNWSHYALGGLALFAVLCLAAFLMAAAGAR